MKEWPTELLQRIEGMPLRGTLQLAPILDKRLLCHRLGLLVDHYLRDEPAWGSQRWVDSLSVQDLVNADDRLVCRGRLFWGLVDRPSAAHAWAPAQVTFHYSGASIASVSIHALLAAEPLGREVLGPLPAIDWHADDRVWLFALERLQPGS